MSRPRHKVRQGWRYEEAERLALELEALLQTHGVRIESGSPLESHVLDVMKLGYQKVSGAAQSDDVREDYRTLIGVHELAASIMTVADSPDFPALVPHLRLLSHGNVLQNAPSSPTDQVTNKLFELFAATLALQCGTEVALDDPDSSKGDNPDVLLTFRGRRWGIACKMLHSKTPEGIAQHLEKGVEQIERSNAEVGFVLFGLKNVLPHGDIWPLGPVDGEPGVMATGCFEDSGAPFEILATAMNAITASLEDHLPEGYLAQAFDGKKSISGFVNWAHSVSGVRVNGKPAPCSVRILALHPTGPLPKDLKCLLECLNWAAHVGSPSRGPKPTC